VSRGRKAAQRLEGVTEAVSAFKELMRGRGEERRRVLTSLTSVLGTLAI